MMEQAQTRLVFLPREAQNFCPTRNNGIMGLAAELEIGALPPANEGRENVELHGLREWCGAERQYLPTQRCSSALRLCTRQGTQRHRLGATSPKQPFAGSASRARRATRSRRSLRPDQCGSPGAATPRGHPVRCAQGPFARKRRSHRTAISPSKRMDELRRPDNGPLSRSTAGGSIKGCIEQSETEATSAGRDGLGSGPVIRPNNDTVGEPR